MRPRAGRRRTREGRRRDQGARRPSSSSSPRAGISSRPRTCVVRVLIADRQGTGRGRLRSRPRRPVAKLEQSRPIVERPQAPEGARIARRRRPEEGEDRDASAIASRHLPGAGAAKVLLAEIALAEKDVAEAEKLFKDALKVVTAKSDRAAAFNGLGLDPAREGQERERKTDADPRGPAALPPHGARASAGRRRARPRRTRPASSMPRSRFQYLGELGRPRRRVEDRDQERRQA